jgi:hemerythrin-like metal-binding protein
VTNKILIVDDEPNNLNVLRNCLTEAGFKVPVLESGETALELVDNIKPDLILLDVMMPGMDGFETCRRLKQNETTKDTPIIFISAKTDAVDKVKGLEMSAVDYIGKPFQAKEVIARVNKHLTIHNLRKQLEEKNKELESKNQLIRQVFGRYLSDEIMQILLDTDSGLTLGGERCEITVLTSDIRGFTAQANKLPPEQVIEILNFYLTAIIKVIDEYQGTINDFMGDGLLVFFGVPVAREDDPKRAIACAVAMQLAMEKVNEQVQSWGFASLEIGIGINTGEVVVGNIGSKTRTKYTAIGDGVNLAYRIESYAIGGQILISESTLKKVSDIIKINSEKMIKSKGIKQPLTIYEIGGIAGKYNLYFHNEEDVFLALQKEIPLQYSVLKGKHIGTQSVNATLLKLSSKGALINTDVEKALFPEVLDNLKINFNLPNSQLANEDVYAKVLDYETNENTLYICFTSIPRNVKAQLVALFKIEWTPAFSGNHSTIDEQHQELFRKINELLHFIGEEQEDCVLEILDFLGAYAVTHFTMEETLMKQADYPHYAEHKAQHTKFIEVFSNFKRRYEQNHNKEGHLFLALSIQQKLVNWLIHHVGQSDKKLGDFLNNE